MIPACFLRSSRIETCVQIGVHLRPMTESEESSIYIFANHSARANIGVKAAGE